MICYLILQLWVCGFGLVWFGVCVLCLCCVRLLYGCLIRLYCFSCFDGIAGVGLVVAYRL